MNGDASVLYSAVEPLLDRDLLLLPLALYADLGQAIRIGRATPTRLSYGAPPCRSACLQTSLRTLQLLRSTARRMAPPFSLRRAATLTWSDSCRLVRSSRSVWPSSASSKGALAGEYAVRYRVLHRTPVWFSSAVVPSRSTTAQAAPSPRTSLLLQGEVGDPWAAVKLSRRRRLQVWRTCWNRSSSRTQLSLKLLFGSCAACAVSLETTPRCAQVYFTCCFICCILLALVFAVDVDATAASTLTVTTMDKPEDVLDVQAARRYELLAGITKASTLHEESGGTLFSRVDVPIAVSDTSLLTTTKFRGVYDPFTEAGALLPFKNDLNSMNDFLAMSIYARRTAAVARAAPAPKPPTGAAPAPKPPAGAAPKPPAAAAPAPKPPQAQARAATVPS